MVSVFFWFAASFVAALRGSRTRNGWMLLASALMFAVGFFFWRAWLASIG